MHAFLVVRSEDGKLLGTGEEMNVPEGRVWRSRLTFHFRDGSLDDDTAVYAQDATLRLISDHHIQKGPSFPKPMNMLVDVPGGRVTYHEEKDGKDEARTETMDLPNDLANGILPMVLQNMSAGETRVKYVAATPKPRLITFDIHEEGQEGYTIGGAAFHSIRYRLHPDLGGLAGIVAPMVGKQPPDLAAWISSGEAPTFLKFHCFFYLGGPMLQIELASPAWSTR